MNNALQSLVGFLQTENEFVLIAHTSPDGDTIGSCLALFAALKKLNKQVQLVCDLPVPGYLHFLPNADKFLLPADLHASKNVIAVDCAAPDRLGAAQPLFTQALNTANIDHHATNEGYAGLNLIDSHAAATAVLIHRLIKALDVDIDADIATCLFTALSTDTGNFSYSNTNSDTFAIAADLLKTGIDISVINRKLYRNKSLSKVRLTGYVVQKIELYANQKIGLARAVLHDLEAYQATKEDTEGIVEIIRDISTVEIAVFIRQSGSNEYKVQLRSKEFADVGQIAASFGGGGHMRAAGCTMTGTLEEIQCKVIQAATAALAI